jgi:hypothetical protein
MTTASGSLFNPAIAAQGSVGDARSASLFLGQQENVALVRSHIGDGVADEFKKHEKKWKQGTRHLSSPTDKYLHPSHARIIGLGWPAVAHILRSLKRRPDDWFYALRAITGENPVPVNVAGDIKQMSEHWFSWGKQRGLI